MLPSIRTRPAFLMGALVLCSVCSPAIGQDAETKQRAKAVREMAKEGAPAIAKIAAYLDDAEPLVRADAVRTMTELGTARSIDPLLKALSDSDPEVVVRATDGLVNFYLPGYVKTGLAGRLGRVGDAVRGKFVDEANDQVIEPWIEVRPELAPALNKLITSSAVIEVRANAARAAGVLRVKGSVDDLLGALRSKDSRLMFESLVALEKIREPRSGPRVAFLFRDPEERVAIKSLEVAGLLRSLETAADMQTAYSRASSVKVKRAALSALALLGQPQVRPQFVAAMGDKDDGLRTAAAEGLARLKDPADSPQLDQCLNEEKKMPPRLACAFGLVLGGRIDLGEASALRYLLNTLNSKAWKGVAEGYLVEAARTKQVRTSLEGIALGATKDEKMGLGRVLAASGDTDSQRIVEQLSRDPDADVMREGVRALRILRARLP